MKILLMVVTLKEIVSEIWGDESINALLEDDKNWHWCVHHEWVRKDPLFTRIFLIWTRYMTNVCFLILCNWYFDCLILDFVWDAKFMCKIFKISKDQVYPITQTLSLASIDSNNHNFNILSCCSRFSFFIFKTTFASSPVFKKFFRNQLNTLNVFLETKPFDGWFWRLHPSEKVIIWKFARDRVGKSER